jgi:phage regulator Rha-like protein
MEELRMNNLTIIEVNGKFVVDSREVARMIEREHKEVLAMIEGQKHEDGRTKHVGFFGVISESGLFNSQDFFIPHTYKTDGNNKTYKCYLLTKKGCDMVANKMTGEKGILFTAAYVTKFDEMEKQISLNLPQTYKQALLALVATEEEKERLQLESKQKDQIINELQPKATYYDLILQTQNALSASQIAKDYGWSATKLNQTLSDLGVQYKQGGVWLLYQRYAEFGYTQSKTHNFINTKTGKMESALHTYWTQKGRIFIYELLKRNLKKLPQIEET